MIAFTGLLTKEKFPYLIGLVSHSSDKSKLPYSLRTLRKEVKEPLL